MSRNKKPIVAVTRRLPEAVESRLAQHFDIRQHADDRQLDRDGIVALCDGCDGVFCCSTETFDQAVMDDLPLSVGIIATYSVGYDHIDVAAAHSRGICVTNTPDVLTDATAEIAVLLILAACRRARESQQLIESGSWGRWMPTQLLGMQLGTARIGFVGMGRIARRPRRC